MDFSTKVKAELIIVALRFVPVAMDRSDQLLRFLDCESIDHRSIRLLDARAR
jgi:hypothetical protein